MLFDLRSRGRRRTVQGVYLALAIILGGGLVLFGVGTGSGVGGLLDAFTNNGSGSNKPVISQAEKSAVKQTQLQPNNPAAWAALVQARYSAANQYALYFHCQTDLVETFRELYPSELTYGGNRSIVLNAEDELPEQALRHCVALALTYHLNKRKVAHGK